MNGALVPFRSDVPAVRLGTAQQLIEDWLGSHSERTIREYKRDLNQFATWCGLKTPLAVDGLLSCEMGEANAILLRYRTAMKDQGLSPATVNRRLSAVRSLVTLARRLGKVTWTPEVQGLKHESYRDTRGPVREEVTRLLEHVSADKNTLMAVRNAALVMLLAGQGLRRNEVSSLDLIHFDGRGARLSIFGKSRTQREWVTLSTQSVKALNRWVGRRGRDPGPLFYNIDRHGKLGTRLQGDGIHDLTERWEAATGIRVRPHKLRHSFVNEALEATNGNLHAVRKAARWKKLDTVVSYDDNRTDVAGDVVAQVSARIGAIVDQPEPAEVA